MTIYDIAKLCGVAPSTVSKVLHGYKTISRATREKVIKVAVENHFVINAKAQLIAKQQSFCIGLIVKSKTKESQAEFMRYFSLIIKLNDALNKDGYNVLILKSDNQGMYLQDKLSHPNDGVIILGNGKEDLSYISKHYPTTSFSWTDYLNNDILLDNEEKSFELTEHLIFNSHKKIVLIIDNTDTSETRDRIAGFKRALAKHNLFFNENMIFNVSSYEDDITAINELIKKCSDPSAVMFPSDISAIRYSLTLRRVGIDIPRDMSITGFGGFDTENLLSKRLTSIRIDSFMIANLLEKQLLSKINNSVIHEKVVVKSTLVLGETTSFARNSKN